MNCNRNEGLKKKERDRAQRGIGNRDITQSLLALLKASGTGLVTAETVAQRIADQLVRQALQGNFQAIKEILDRTEGRVPQAAAAEDSENTLTVVLQDVICSRCSLEQARADWLASAEGDRLLAGGAESKSDHAEQNPSANGDR